ncbi:hypothetical protein HYPSUDRAFT_196864 [Hypholoma sublateritium FD-334 SS-4]|uniref:Uncharacterized protein n=1 Tax=Hypholoma sublateritium (strain FD-334 SS-4) TaxID=945553 RepID=A0A0D2PJY9_HYPSF|nr:hypothetical protein HYPSUDRAFT_196864 [Hypholoma sublateritium FD-334 SS-4]
MSNHSGYTLNLAYNVCRHLFTFHDASTDGLKATGLIIALSTQCKPKPTFSADLAPPVARPFAMTPTIWKKPRPKSPLLSPAADPVRRPLSSTEQAPCQPTIFAEASASRAPPPFSETTFSRPPAMRKAGVMRPIMNGKLLKAGELNCEAGILTLLAQTHLNLGRSQVSDGFQIRNEVPAFHTMAWKTIGDAVFQLTSLSAFTNEPAMKEALQAVRFIPPQNTTEQQVGIQHWGIP